MDRSIDVVIANRLVTSLFQPIMAVGSQSLLGYESLSRGPSDSRLHSPVELFAAASAVNRSRELDFLCFETAVRRRAELGLNGRLFVNLTPAGLLELGSNTQLIRETLGRFEMAPEQLVFELTEQAIMDDFPAIREAMLNIRKLGIAFAIDDLGAGYSGLRAWSELSPEFVKIDRYFISSIDTDSLKMEFVRAIVDLARAAGSTVIAEGVETRGELSELRDAGITLVQGFHVAPPKSEPVVNVTDTMVERTSFAEAPQAGATASDLVFEAEAVSPTMIVSQVAKLFHEQVDLQAIPVVADGRPLGVIRRSELLDILSLPLRQELFGRKPIMDLMDRNPLLVESDLKLEQVSRIVTRGYQERLQEQFIITQDGRYRGMGRVIDLLRAITQEQIHSAKHANPLTTLPGNVPIYDCVNGLLRREKRFALCYIDVDNFKPFNDFYGYSKGDEALVTLSRTLIAQACPRVDFVGHVGGDDFVAVFRSEDWAKRIARLFSELDRAFANLYRPEHVEQGGIVTRDRYGLERHFPLLSISVAAIVCESVPDCTAEDLAYMIAPLKLQAKQTAGNSLVVESFADIANAEVEFESLVAAESA